MVEEAAKIVIQAVHSIWEDWSESLQPFEGERPPKNPAHRRSSYMHTAFKDGLESRLSGRLLKANCSPLQLGQRLSDWTQYDIGVFDGSTLLALLELSYGDTDVHHALHNGELKLLGDCSGVSVSISSPYWKERHFTSGDIELVRTQLSKIPVRGLFFVNGDERRKVLDVRDEATWWPTRDGNPKFRSAVMAPETRVTLREVFTRLANEGLCCWFYSLFGEERLEFIGSTKNPN